MLQIDLISKFEKSCLIQYKIKSWIKPGAKTFYIVSLMLSTILGNTTAFKIHNSYLLRKIKASSKRQKVGHKSSMISKSKIIYLNFSISKRHAKGKIQRLG